MTLEFIEGPLWYAAVIIFAVGVVYRLFAILKLGTKPDYTVDHKPHEGSGIRTVFSRFWPRHEFLRPALFILVLGLAFHFALFILVFFADPHVEFIHDRILGFSWAAMPYWGMMLAASLTLATVVVLWMRRLLDPVRRKISTFDDHFTAFLLIAVILSGFAAIQETYTAPRALHMLLFEVLLIYFPFSKLMHTFTFFISRYYTGNNYARRGVKV